VNLQIIYVATRATLAKQNLLNQQTTEIIENKPEISKTMMQTLPLTPNPIQKFIVSYAMKIMILE